MVAWIWFQLYWIFCMSWQSKFSLQAAFAVFWASWRLDVLDAAHSDLQQILLLSPLAIPVPLCTFDFHHPLCSGSGAHTQLCLCTSVFAADAEKAEPDQVWQDSEREALCCTVWLWPCCFQIWFRSLSSFATSAKSLIRPDKLGPGRTSQDVLGPCFWGCEGWEPWCKDTWEISHKSCWIHQGWLRTSLTRAGLP